MMVHVCVCACFETAQSLGIGCILWHRLCDIVKDMNVGSLCVRNL